MLQTDKEDVDLKDLHDHIDELVSHEMNVLWAASRDHGDCIDWEFDVVAKYKCVEA